MRSTSPELEKWAARTPLFILVYFALQLGVRLLLSSNLEVDDAEMVGQTAWAWGYPNSHPPLYHWLVRICYEAFGSWVAATSVPKFALLALGYFLVFDAVRRSNGANIAGAAAVAVFFFIPVVAWKTEGKLTHSILGFAATAGTLHALVMIVTRRSVGSFVWVGIASAAGILAKYNFLIVLVGAAIAVLAVGEMRRAIFRKPLWLAALVFVALIAPHLFWLRDHAKLAGERLYMLRTGGGPLGLNLPAHSVLDGLASLLLVVLVSVLPAAVILCLSRGRAQENYLRRFAGIWLLAELLVLVLVMIAGKIFQIHERYLLVLLPPFAVWMGLNFKRQRLAFIPALIVAVAITVARPLSVMCSNSRLAWPYAEMAREVKKMTSESVSIFADRPENAANIAIRLPSAAIFDPRNPAANLVLLADAPDLLPDLDGYEAISEVRILEFPFRWQPERKAKLAVQLWRKRD